VFPVLGSAQLYVPDITKAFQPCQINGTRAVGRIQRCQACVRRLAIPLPKSCKNAHRSPSGVNVITGLCPPGRLFACSRCRALVTSTRENRFRDGGSPPRLSCFSSLKLGLGRGIRRSSSATDWNRRTHEWLFPLPIGRFLGGRVWSQEKTFSLRS
jgi:hypothetical protein